MFNFSTIGKRSGNGWTSLNTANLVIEGHSFMVDYADLPILINERINHTSVYNGAVVGATIQDCIDRGVVTDSKLVSETSLLKNILILCIGVNDVDDTAGEGLTAYNLMKSYIQARTLAGWKVIVYTMTPVIGNGKNAQFEIERNVFNNLIRTDLSLLSKVYILDTDTKAELSNTIDVFYFYDLIHPSPNGAFVMAKLLVEKLANINAINLIVPDNRPDPMTVLTLTHYSGNYSGVSTLTLNVNAETILTLDGTARFYTDSAGTQGESKSWTVTSGGDRTIYIKSSTNKSYLRIPSNTITKIIGWLSPPNAPWIGNDISRLTSLNWINIGDENNVLSGSITGLTGMLLLNLYGQNSLSGSIASMLNLLWLEVSGTNTLSGSVAGLTNVAYIKVFGSNTLTFPNVTALTQLGYLYVHTSVTLTSANVNQILADFWTNKDIAKGTAQRIINIAGSVTSGAPTGQGIVDKAALQGYSSPTPPGTAALWTVTTR